MPLPGRNSAPCVRFGAFELNTRTLELSNRGLQQKLSNQACRLLRALLERHGEIVTRDELKEVLWGDSAFVDADNAINKMMSQVRAVLHDDLNNPRFIETLSKRGYRFIAPVATHGSMGDDWRTMVAVAVLPFENLTGSPEQQFIADGMSEAIISRLGGVPRLRVISRTSAVACGAGSKALSLIGRELGIDAVVEGSVMQAGNSVRVTVRLVRIQDELCLWQEIYDRDLPDLWSLYDDVGQEITKTITPSSLYSPPACSRNSISVAPEAQLAYLRGRYLWNRRREKDLYASVEEFQRALAISPDLAIAEAGLADTYVLIGIWGLESSHSAFRMARRAAERALKLNATLAEAHCCLAEVLKDYDWEWHEAESEFRRAIALNPNYSTAHQFYAQLLIVLRRYAEAVEHIEMARRTDPLSPAINAFLPYIYLASRDYEHAVREGCRAVELEPFSALAHWMRGRAYLFAGATRQAVSDLETAASLGGDRSIWLAELCFARARADDKPGAEAILAQLLECALHSYISPYDIALCFTGLGNHSAAMDYLEQAYHERVMRLISIGDPELDDLRSEPRFVSLVQQLKIPPSLSITIIGKN